MFFPAQVVLTQRPQAGYNKSAGGNTIDRKLDTTAKVILFSWTNTINKIVTRGAISLRITRD